MTPHYWTYSEHKTETEASAALEHYFADGAVCEAEKPRIVSRKGRYLVQFCDNNWDNFQ